MAILDYSNFWHFWLDDACYQISRGTRCMAIAGECSHELWDTEIKPAISKLREHHGVLIEARGDEEGVEILIAKNGWCFNLYDYADTHPEVCHAIRGMLFGYDSESISNYLHEKDGGKQ